MARIKGIAVIGLVKALRALRGVAESRLPAAQRHYLGERILISEWYPEEDYRVLLLTLGELVDGQVPGDVWEFIGEEGAKHQFGEIYTMVVRQGDPAGTLRRSGTTWALYHDSGRVETTLDATSAQIELHDYSIACEPVCATTTGYLRQLLLQSGAREPQVRMLACPAPDQGPVVWEASWTPP